VSGFVGGSIDSGNIKGGLIGAFGMGISSSITSGVQNAWDEAYALNDTVSAQTGGKFANGAVTSAFSSALSSAGRGGGGDEGGATTCALGDCPGEQLIAGPLEYLTPTRVYFQGGPSVTYVDGHSWIADWSGASAGDRAAQYWADRHVQTGNPMYAVPGVFASLWTPDTAGYTAVTLGTAGAGALLSRAGWGVARDAAHKGMGPHLHYGPKYPNSSHPMWHFGPRNPIHGRGNFAWRTWWENGRPWRWN